MAGALGAVSRRLDTWLEKLGITINTGLRRNNFVEKSKELKEGVGKL